MELRRSSGILLHPTSLPGPWGIGELGDEARGFLDFLAGAGQRLWQVLPLGPTGYGDSPYQTFSVFAGNPLLIGTDRLIAAGLLDPDVREEAPAGRADRVDYGAVTRFKGRVLRRAYGRFQPDADFARFQEEHAGWLDDYALFMALKERHGGVAWGDWSPDLARRRPGALARARADLAREIGYHQFTQWLFFRQWGDLKREAGARRIAIVGDLPIFAAYDSADVWANPEFFHLDAAGRPTVVAGVPPDYFSATGQLWGNPLYRWEALEREGFRWWVERLRLALALYDYVRIDHFRGFEAYWEIPAGEPTAIRGQWVKAPGARLFATVREQLGELPIIAEDLGVITPEVEALRDEFGLPGMKILQFGFTDPDNPDLPHHYVPHRVVYTGTHDNDTTRGWYASIPEGERDFARRYLGRGAEDLDIAWDLIRAAFASVARFAVIPLQDVLDLGTEARMNYPGRLGGNWAWRYSADALTPARQERLRDLAVLYSR